jgi:hypothetical protein
MVAVGVGVSVLVNVIVGVGTAVVGLNTSGVAVITDGVREGIAVHTGKGWGVTPNVMHELSKRLKIGSRKNFFIK